ncbi:sperm-associated antigen 17, partial [Brachionus plicatilis]
KKAENTDLSFFTSPLNDDEWNATIIMINPSDALEELYLEQLEKTVRAGYRRRFTWLSKKDLTDLVIEATGKKGASSPKKPSSVQAPLPPALISALEQAKASIDNKEELSESLLCQILKGKLIHIKTIEKEKEVMRLGTQPSKTGTKTAQTAKKDKSPGRKSPSKAKKGNAGPLPEIDKQSQLKKKEEIEEEEKYVDDEPKDGPNHYIILSGFYSPNFFNQLDDFMIPIDCLIKFKAANKNLIENFMLEIEERERLETNLKANLKLSESDNSDRVNVEQLSEERRNYLKKVKLELEKFWSESAKLFDKPQDKLIQHVARLKISLKQDPQLKSWFDLESRVSQSF